MRRSLCLMLAQLFFICGGFGFAQNASTGALSGVVTDPMGAVVGGAKIRIINSSTGETREIKSASAGTYSAALLRPGTYVGVASRDGFQETKYDHVVVNVTETEALNIAPAVGDTSDPVEVSAAS